MKILIPVELTITTAQLLDLTVKAEADPDSTVTLTVAVSTTDNQKESGHKPDAVNISEDERLIRALKKKHKVWQTTSVVLRDCPDHGNTIFYTTTGSKNKCVLCKRAVDALRTRQPSEKR